MLTSYIRVALAALPLLAFASPASANFSGSYTLQSRIGPDHTRGARQCVVFTQTGDVIGFPDSGTWIMPSFQDNLNGFFIVDHQRLRFYATYQSGSHAIDLNIKLKDGIPSGHGGFDDWRVADPPLPVDDGIFKLTVTSGCDPRGHKSKTLTGG